MHVSFKINKITTAVSLNLGTDTASPWPWDITEHCVGWPHCPGCPAVPAIQPPPSLSATLAAYAPDGTPPSDAARPSHHAGLGTTVRPTGALPMGAQRSRGPGSPPGVARASNHALPPPLSPPPPLCSPLLVLSTVFALLPLASALGPPTQSSPEPWMTGPWGQCVARQCRAHGVQGRAVWCAHPTGRAIVSPSTAATTTTALNTATCDPSTRPPHRRSCVRTCTGQPWHDTSLPWDTDTTGSTGEPGECRPLQQQQELPAFSAGECDPAAEPAGCGPAPGMSPGAQDGGPPGGACDTRHSGNSGGAGGGEGAGGALQNSCIVSGWSKWGACGGGAGSACGPGGTRLRVRRVLFPPSHGGAACVELSESQACTVPAPCPTSAPGDAFSTSQYRLRVGAWSECLPVSESRIARRSVPQVRWALQASRKRPRRSSVSWGPEEAGGEPDEGQAWDVRLGAHARDLSCLSRLGEHVDLVLCNRELMAVPSMEEVCILPRDCDVGDWSAWSPCSVTCSGQGHNQGHGQVQSFGLGLRTRIRSVQHPALAGGKGCPSLQETEACGGSINGILPPCPRYRWRGGAWAACTVGPLLDQHERCWGNQTAWCGGGVQVRDIYCSLDDDNVFSYLKGLRDAPSRTGQRAGEGGMPTTQPLLSLPLEPAAPRPVETGLCPELVPLESTRPCEQPCPHECVLSAWSAWGPCVPETCTPPTATTGFMMRTRRVLGGPIGAGGAPDGCPHLLEAVPCEGARCFRWRVAEVSICIPTNTKCGAGTQFQRVVCTDQRGVTVGPELCGEPGFPMQLACQVPCWEDCAMSEWGQWMPCSHTCLGGEGSRAGDSATQGRQVRVRAILALPGDGGRQCPDRLGLQEWRPCNQHGCTVHYWHALPWGPCVHEVTQGSPNASQVVADGEAACATGVQMRVLTCMRVGGGQLPTDRCPLSQAPMSRRACLVPCRRDCTLSPFSDWTPCPDPCRQTDGAPTPRQWRFRVVIQRASGGGRPCPKSLSDMRPCPTRPCPQYRWRTHRWGQCHLLASSSARAAGANPGESPCGQGLQTRGVSCHVEGEGHVDPRECLTRAAPMPMLAQPCRVPCASDCALSSWSPWTHCPSHPGCGATQTRRRSLTGRSKRREECKVAHTFPLLESQPCPCNTHTSRPTGPWSDCIVTLGEGRPGDGPAVAGEPECGKGVRLQAVSCYDHEEHLTRPEMCNSPGWREEACEVACPVDCALGEWIPWSPCSKSCGAGMSMRSRKIQGGPSHGGRPCPPPHHALQVYEAMPCYSDCALYTWVSDPWEVCSVPLSGVCGEGTQTRTVRCEVQSVEGPGTPVEEVWCDPTERPQDARACVLQCPGECVMSEWGPWTRCPQPCEVDTVRIRSRFIQRMPADGEMCPDDTESEPCTPQHSCFYYHYNATGWGSCMLGGPAVCGQGSRARALECVRNDLKPVDLRICQAIGLKTPRPLSEPCSVECPLDCRISSWTSWSSCSRTCGLTGMMKRSRRVLRAARGFGRPCPSQLQQSKPCTPMPCYRLQLGDWSSCQLNGGDCGEGVCVRELTCLSHNGSGDDPVKKVEQSLCEEMPWREVMGALGEEGRQPELKKSCIVSCPGDCRLGTWSTWGVCQLLSCRHGVPVAGPRGPGVQARSQHVELPQHGMLGSCPLQQWEARECSGGKCYSYEWHVGPWVGGRRDSWCQRSDGVNVTGGCSLANEPKAVHSCTPPCLLPHSYCAEISVPVHAVQRDVCVCEEGYQEVVTLRGSLEHCTQVSRGRERPAEGQGWGQGLGGGAASPSSPGPAREVGSWALEPFGDDGKLRGWVYGVAVASLLIIGFLLFTAYLFWRRSKRPRRRVPKRKPLPLPFDGDADL
ncbi:thrombospondin type-1 domain-containing protein 7A-like isoform X1 [Petromyzon marinus]|uniref:thrombospondin type-1 domain-containing protein 7A-like isoform X1 n=1 Tax=Petromyzon marinus TaxID=7757 RepID=UPI003F6F3502